MADIKLNVSGDASGGKRAMSEAAQSVDRLGDSAKSLGGSLNQLGDAERAQANQLNVLKAGFLAVGAAAVKIGADCVQAFAAAERVTLQLGRAAGSLSGVFEAQADALESQLHVDGELIKQQQTLLLQWGAAPRAIEPTIRAIEDYAAATGKDALTATTELIKGVETGGAKFKALGITYEHTGDKTKDLANLTAALSEKFAGANKANSDSLAGRLEYASIAFDNVKESFGGLIGAMESKLGILEKASGVLQSLARGVSGGQSTTVMGQINDFMRNFTAEGLLQHAVIGIAGSQLQTPEVPNVPATFGNSKTAEGQEKDKKSETEAKQHAAAMKKIYDDNAEDQRKFLKDIEEMDDNAAAKERENWADDLEMSAKRVEMDLKEAADRVAIREKMRADIDKGNAEHAERQAKEEKKAKEDAAKQATKDAKEQADSTKAAADQIGAAFVNGLTAQLAKLAEGGEFDVALFVGDLLAVAFSAAATVIGTVYGMPALGAAVGNLGATGIRFGASEISKQNKQSKYHDGGWVGAPRHHEGAFIGSDEQRAILQTGERVLSRDEVRGMGGPSAVDKMAKGTRSGININISAIDTKGVAQSFMGDGSRGLKRALKSGRGDLPSLLGGTPR